MWQAAVFSAGRLLTPHVPLDQGLDPREFQATTAFGSPKAVAG